jgi:hypothetical protein
MKRHFWLSLGFGVTMKLLLLLVVLLGWTTPARAECYYAWSSSAGVYCFYNGSQDCYNTCYAPGWVSQFTYPDFYCYCYCCYVG